MTRNFLYWKKRGIKFVTPFPLFGNLFSLLTFKKSAGQFFYDIYKNSSNQPYVGFFGLDKPMLLIRDPEIIKNVLVKDFNFFNNRFGTASPHDDLGKKNLFMLKNPAWKYVRTKLTPIYTSSRMKLTFERMLIVALDLDTHLKSLNLKDKKSIEVKEICAKFTTDMIAMTAFGLRANSLNNPNAEFRKNGEKIFKPTVYRSIEWYTRAFAPYLMGLLGFTFFTKEAGTFLRDALWSTITERERSGQKRNDLVDLLIELKNNDVNNPDKKIFEFKGDNLTAQAAVFFIAGFHTSSSLLSCTLYELALHPQYQDRVRQEINNLLEENNGKITYDMMSKLTYSEMVLNETLRKYPVLPFLDRVAVDDYKVPGHDLVIEKGTPIFISVSGVQMDPQYFDNPDEFNPERFSPDNKKIITGTYLPFGIGPHACIGVRLGLLQSKLGLLKIISKYEFSPSKDTEIPIKMSTKGLSMIPKSGIFLNVNRI